MKEKFRNLLISLLIFCQNLNAETNLGTLNTVQNGFGTVEECKSSKDEDSECKVDLYESLKDVLNFTTTNQCISTKTELKESGVSIPKCPKSEDQVKGLDNTYPTVGIFALYNGRNDSFIYDLANNYLNSNKSGKFNLVLPKDEIDSLKKNSKLLKLLNNPRVNIVPVLTTPKVKKWMQDSFEFTMINGKPALYQLDHYRESEMDLKDRLACQLAKQCNIPYYVPPDILDPSNADSSGLNSGGNLEILPGGTFYTGTIQTQGFGKNISSSDKIPYRTKVQESQRKSLEKAGNKVLDLDVSFLTVGHVDEIVNVVKTNRPAPCDFAIMLANSKLAIDLMEKAASESKGKATFNMDLFIISNAYAEDQRPRCSGTSYIGLEYNYRNKIMSKEELQRIYASNCIDGSPVEDFISSDEFKIIKRQNLGQESPASISSIMEKNKALIINELKETSGCENPEIIDVPVFFRNGVSYTPDLVNGVVESPPGEASNVMLPRSYFGPFDTYLQDKLGEYGIDTTYVHDMGYHLELGEVHCGSNTARICE